MGFCFPEGEKMTKSSFMYLVGFLVLMLSRYGGFKGPDRKWAPKEFWADGSDDKGVTFLSSGDVQKQADMSALPGIHLLFVIKSSYTPSVSSHPMGSK
jgi:hypothetical protein